MKKSILLAPAVAVAIAGFGAVPAIAGTTPTPEPSETPVQETPVDDGTPEDENTSEETVEEDVTDEGDVSPETTAVSNEEAIVTVQPEVVSAEDLTDEDAGVTFVVSNMIPGTSVANSLTDDVEEADDDGVAAVSVFYDGDASDFEPGEEVQVDLTLTHPDADEVVLNAAITIEGEASDDESKGEEAETPTPTPTEDQWTWEFGELSEGLNLETEQVSTDKFVNEGVAFAVLGCEPGQEVTFTVTAGRDDVEAYEATGIADEDGIAVDGVRGLDPESARAYIGEYTVTAACGDNEWTDTFYVGDRPSTDDDEANAGSDDSTDDDATAGSTLPRTGTELTGLAAGAGLLVLGAATVFLTRRRAAKTGPADI
ncbi:hypothetical protein GCM10022261_20150 [Brevibacterium daeguense]|uniref:Gram-positive cocci surface proteins LPxTG domain-containing protein n=1 Tax=Brevibacterium daeguense TaxID=909936 RepID=A0ABP8EKH6_9MICO|nr:LPXTG cell wall anchor domain-containing protein [Brevibacterium daeguense]